MFAQDFQIVDHAQPEVAACLCAGVASHVDAALMVARAAGELARAQVGLSHCVVALSDCLQLTCRPARVHGDTTLIPIHWEASGPPSLLACLDGDLEVAPFGDSRTQLVLRAGYGPVSRRVGPDLDARLLHRVAESALRAFLLGVCASVKDAMTEQMEGPCPETSEGLPEGHPALPVGARRPHDEHNVH